MSCLHQAKQLYLKLEQLLVAKNYITQHQSNVICRRNHRKEWAWKRHVLDLCEFVLDFKKPDLQTAKILLKAIGWAKQFPKT